MKNIKILATTYTAKQLAEIDIKAFRSKTAYRYRQDIFPNPDGFDVKILSVVPEIVPTGDQIYPARLKLTVFVPDETDDAKLARFKKAIEQKTRRFDIVRAPERIVEHTEPKPAEDKPAEDKTESAPEKEKQKKKPSAKSGKRKNGKNLAMPPKAEHDDHQASSD